jgi:hypothetical protein
VQLVFGPWRDDVVLVAQSPVEVTEDIILGGVQPDRQVRAHAITASRDTAARKIVAQVALYSCFHYRIVLGDEPLIEPSIVQSGHVFDPVSRQIRALTRDPLKARPLPMALEADSDEKPI